ncbi:hypothetical protein AAFF_G00220900 [Aldrovandia affinis]|uniref:Uncharacterized protein n=1 Tax=Aldrovandia affinis TaxID=143900 RepID=A0AAD7RFU6_9TELE|nr:hypothetical protein AAFF_G00220900 [Aldrovandia affinis]
MLSYASHSGLASDPRKLESGLSTLAAVPFHPPVHPDAPPETGQQGRPQPETTSPRTPHRVTTVTEGSRPNPSAAVPIPRLQATGPSLPFGDGYASRGLRRGGGRRCTSSTRVGV